MTDLAEALPGAYSPYGYTPTEWICILFVALYSVSTSAYSSWIDGTCLTLIRSRLVLHVGQATRYRLWWLFPTAILAGITEIIGWSGRLWSSINPIDLDPYLMQFVFLRIVFSQRLCSRLLGRITTTIIAPTPLVAANFILLGQIINILGLRYSRLSAAWCEFYRMTVGISGSDGTF